MKTPAFVICGPTAVGKGTVIRELVKKQPRIWFSISTTTRAPRAGEIDGQHYFFATPEEFDALVDAGNMLEWATVHGIHRYGTPRQPVLDAIAKDRAVLLEVDLAGARQVRESFPEAVQIFIAPPTFDDLVARLEMRGTEDPEERQRRLETARVELDAAHEFDYIVVNDDVSRATDEILGIIESIR